MEVLELSSRSLPPPSYVCLIAIHCHNFCRNSERFHRLSLLLFSEFPLETFRGAAFPPLCMLLQWAGPIHGPVPMPAFLALHATYAHHPVIHPCHSWASSCRRAADLYFPITLLTVFFTWFGGRNRSYPNGLTLVFLLFQPMNLGGSELPTWGAGGLVWKSVHTEHSYAGI